MPSQSLQNGTMGHRMDPRGHPKATQKPPKIGGTPVWGAAGWQNGRQKCDQNRNKVVPDRIPNHGLILAAFLDHPWAGRCGSNTTPAISKQGFAVPTKVGFWSPFGLPVGALLGPFSAFWVSRPPPGMSSEALSNKKVNLKIHIFIQTGNRRIFCMLSQRLVIETGAWAPPSTSPKCCK